MGQNNLNGEVLRYMERQDAINSKLEDGVDTLSKDVAVVSTKLDIVITKQDKTNGRVSRLERFAWMAIGVLTVMNLVVIPLLIEQIKTWIAK